VSFRVEPEPTTAIAVFDTVKVRSILRNLVVNAVKFTSGGSIVLRIESTRGRLRFLVRDTGVGIPPEEQESIFEAFRQLDGSSTRSYGGIGLGLAVSRRLARVLGGDVTVESEPGVGSTFTLTIPVPEAESSDTARSAASSRPERGILAA
jgi:signal transduction histidine kinase